MRLIWHTIERELRHLRTHMISSKLIGVYGKEFFSDLVLSNNFWQLSVTDFACTRVLGHLRSSTVSLVKI